MPEISEEELGRRRFQIRKEKAVEEALTRIRRNIGPDWSSIPHEDLESLKALLEDVWVNGNRERWEGYSFSALTKEQAGTLVSIWKDSRRGGQKPEDVLRAADRILSGGK